MSLARAHWVLVSLALACGGDGQTTADPTKTTLDASATDTGPGNTGDASQPTGDGGTMGTMDTTGTTGTTAPTDTSNGESNGPGTTDITGGGGADGGLCQEACSEDGDCLVEGVDQGYVCSDSRCRPGGKPDKCNSDLFCQIAAAALFTSFCKAPEACGPTKACVELAGFSQGACVARTADMVGECSGNFMPATLPLLGGGEAEVCVVAADEIFCGQKPNFEPVFYCELAPAPCDSDAQCTMNPTQPVCSAGSCVCTEDAHCAGLAGYTQCVEGRCACANDRDCAALPGSDVCVDGVCGCGSASVCPDATYFDSTEIVCEPA